MASIQCKALTTKKTQCKFNSVNDGYCRIHLSNSKPTIQQKKEEVPLEKLEIELDMNSMGCRELGSCSICLENVYDSNSAKLECKHEFHLKCILQLRNTLCPGCRATIKSELVSEEQLKKMEQLYELDNGMINRISRDDYIREGSDEFEDIHRRVGLLTVDDIQAEEIAIINRLLRMQTIDPMLQQHHNFLQFDDQYVLDHANRMRDRQGSNIQSISDFNDFLPPDTSNNDVISQSEYIRLGVEQTGLTAEELFRIMNT
jgi:hypothetical protein